MRNSVHCTRGGLLIDGDLGSQQLKVGQAHAWNWRALHSDVVRISFPVQGFEVSHVRLFFYNEPLWGFGLSSVQVFADEDTALNYTITGNQDLNHTDHNYRNITIVLMENYPYSSRLLHISFRRTDINLVWWLLLSEIQICGGQGT